MSVTDLVKGTTVKFTHYQDGNLWYEVEGKNFTFPVPLEDTGSARFPSVEKAMLFMRWIRKHKTLIDTSKE